MPADPIHFFRTELPALFHRGVEGLRQAADGGDPRAASQLADTLAAEGALRLVFERADDAAAEVWLSVHQGAMSAADQGTGARVVLAAPLEAARAALEEVEAAGFLREEHAPLWLSRMVSAEAERELAQRPLKFHLTLTDLPDEPQEVTIRVGIGVAEPPPIPDFSAIVSWDDVEDVRLGDMSPQQLIGRIKLVGDASGAMALAMTLVQKRQSAAGQGRE